MPELETEFTKEEFKYLSLLAKQYPNISSASTEIINLQAILNLPKGTEHFISDIHGEYEPCAKKRVWCYKKPYYIYSWN